MGLIGRGCRRAGIARVAAAALVLGACLALPARAHADELSELVERADKAFLAKTSAAVLDMEIKTRSYERSYKVVSWDDRRKTEKSLIKILGPAMWRGYGTLKIGNQLQVYNPKTNHVSVVSSSMLGDSWMGSHFTNDDLVHQTDLARDFTLELVDKREKDSPISDRRATYYRVRMTPKPTAPVAWTRIDYELFVDGDHVVPVSAEYYRKGEKPSRTLTFSDIATMAGRTIPTRLTVTVADKPGEYTRITYKKLKLDANIPKSKFTEQALKE